MLKYQLLPAVMLRLSSSLYARLLLVAGWFTTGQNVAGVVYGVIVATAMISVIEDIHNTVAWEVIVQVLAAVFAFRLAEGYSDVIRQHIRLKQGLRFSNLSHLWANTVPPAAGAGIVLLPFVYYAASGLPLPVTNDVDFWGPYGMTDFVVPALMFGLGLAIGRNAGDPVGRCLLTGFGNMIIAGIVIGFKVLVH